VWRASAAPAAEAISGVPVFIGFGDAPHAGARSPEDFPGVCVRRFGRWDERAFGQALRPADGSFLRQAVRGFFANGGERCVVMAVSTPEEAASSETAAPLRVNALLHSLREGGPLESLDEADLICAPDAVSRLVPPASLQEIQTAILDHCRARANRFAILDAPRVLDSRKPVDALERIAQSLRSEYGAMYFPWIVSDATEDDARPGGDLSAAAQWRRAGSEVPSRKSGEDIPPSGHVAGVYARVDRAAQHRAPANERLIGALDATVALSWDDFASINEARVNCITARGARGVAVMGARTLSGLSQFTYVSTARTLIGLRRWIEHNMRDLVFEPQTPLLWDRIHRRLLGHCRDLWRANALAGADESEAYRVRCDDETNPPESRDQGRVIATVSVAPVTPAEFIEVQVIHEASGITVAAAVTAA
jgi:hypothetical protein